METAGSSGEGVTGGCGSPSHTLLNLFKKIRDTKGTFHAKMGSIKDTNGMDLKEAEDIKKRWQEYTEELHDPDKKSFVIQITMTM